MPEINVSLTQSEARTRASLIHNCSYLLELDCVGDPNSYRFRVVIEFQAEPGSSTFVDAQVDRIEEMRWQGEPLGRGAVSSQRIHLNDLAPHNVLEVRGVSAYHRAGLGLHLAVDPADGERYLYSDFEPAEAHRVFPCFDQPDLKGPITLRMRVPQDWTVVSAEPGVAGKAADAEGARWWDFPATPPLSPYVLGIAAGRLHAVRKHHHGIDLGLYSPLSLAQDLEKAAPEVLEVTGQGLDFYRELYRIPYPFSKYDQVFCLEKVNGAMESPGCVTISDRMIYRGRPSARESSLRAEVILHEMAHMWFGDLVTLRWWDDLWLNESFATFMAAVAQDRATSFEDAWTYWATVFKQVAVEEDQHTTSHPVVTAVPDVEAVHLNFDRITYQKGAAVLRQLAAWVGEEAFFNAIHNHLERHRFGNAEFQDLLQALEEASGRDVFAWSRSWLETVGINTLRMDLGNVSDRVGDAITSAAVEQSATSAQPTLRAHRIAIGLYDWLEGKLARRRGFEVDVDGATTPVPELLGEGRPPLLLPNDGALSYAKIRLDPVSQATVEGHLGSVQDPLARALVWDSMWDMVRDAELPASRYVRMVTRHLASETDGSLVPAVLGGARGALSRYAAPTVGDSLEAELAEACSAALNRTDAGSPEQLTWLRAFIAAAVTDAQLQLCQEMLDGSRLPDGVVLDLELRWRLVTALAARGRLGQEAVQGMRRADPTSTGIVRGLAAQAAMPSARAKEEVFSYLFGDDSATVEAAIWIGRGFSGIRRDDLLLPFIPRFFSELGAVEARRGPDFTRDLAYWFLPSLPPHPDLLAALRRQLDRGDLQPDLRRIFQDGLEEAERALRAREFDEEAVAGE